MSSIFRQGGTHFKMGATKYWLSQVSRSITHKNKEPYEIYTHF